MGNPATTRHPDGQADLDVVIIAGDTPQEVLGKEGREKNRLTIDGIPATLDFLQHYFACGRDAQRALAAHNTGGVPFISLNGVYLDQFLTGRGFRTVLIPVLSAGREQLLAALARQPAAVVISTTFLPFAQQIDAIASFVKQHAPATTVIAGGVQVWKSYRHKLLADAGGIADDIRPAVCTHNYLMDAARPSPVDVLVVNPRGEQTLVSLLHALRAGDDYHALPNIAFYRDGRWQINPVTEEPAHEIRVDWSSFAADQGRAYFPVMAGQGCGFRCTFCDFCGLFPDVTQRPLDSIIAELRTIPPAGGLRRVFFTDDNLFTTRQRAREMCQALIRANLSLRWRGMVRVSVVDDEIADLMAQSGCTEILLGIESGDETILAGMKKRITRERILQGVGALNRAGINTKSTFIVGFPGETEATLRNTANLLNAYPTSGPGVHRYMFFTFAVLPLSEIAGPESRARHALRGYGYHWAHATMTSAEAAAGLESIQDQLKPELAPSYVLEVPEVAGLDNEAIKRIYYLRNQLARFRRGIPTTESESGLWSELEAAFAAAR